MTSEQITRITSARNTIRNKLVGMGLAESTAKIDTLATTIDGITNNGAVSAEVKEGETYTIPKGYHNGSGTISGVAGGGNYTLQSKTVTPTKTQQNITPDAGKYGLSDVTVEAIPENYQDVSSVDATAADVLANKKIVDAAGKLITGTMPNNGAVSIELDPATSAYLIPKGYHDGTGSVYTTYESVTAIPNTTTQYINPTGVNFLAEVVVEPIPSDYIVTTDATATEDKILVGDTAYVNGVKVTGTMPFNGPHVFTLTAEPEERKYTIPEGYHDGTGVVKIDVETRSVTPTKSAQVIKSNDERKVLYQVTVDPIPDAYQDVTKVNATAADVLTGKTIVDSTGAEIAGAMKNNGNVNLTMDGLSTTSVTIPAGYTAGGTVSLTSDIEEALAAI